MDGRNQGPSRNMAQENTEEGGGSNKARGRRSDVWNHFIRSEDGQTATCTECNKVLRAPSKNGTSRLQRHIDICKRRDGPPSKQQRSSLPAPVPDEPSASAAPGSTALPESAVAQPAEGMSNRFGQEECGAELARMIAFHGYPSSIVEDECFRSFVCGLNPRFQMPSRAAVEGIFHRHAEESMNQFKDTLRLNSGEISLAMGTALTVQGTALYMACQFIDDQWALQKRIMQMFTVVPFPPYHHCTLTLVGAEEVSIDQDEGLLDQLRLPTTSATLKDAVVRWGLPDRLFSVAWGEVLEKHLEEKDYLKDLRPQLDPVLMVWCGGPQVLCVTYTSDVLNSVAETIYAKLDGCHRLHCMKAVKALKLSQQQRDQFLLDLGLKHLGRYDKRWFSYYCALEMLHKAYSENGAASGEPPELNEKQIAELLRRSKGKQGQIWELLGRSRFKESQLTEILRKILGTIYRAIATISTPSRATSNLCLRELMNLRDVLQKEAADASNKLIDYWRNGVFHHDQVVHRALQEAQDVAEKFLQASHGYLPIPAVLDPRFKLGYINDIFKEVLGSAAKDCITEVKDTVQKLFNQHELKRRNLHGEGTSAMDATVTAVILGAEADTELDRYLQHCQVTIGREDDSFNVLEWWRTNRLEYPTVASMARDALAMPASDMLSPEHIARIRSMMCN